MSLNPPLGVHVEIRQIRSDAAQTLSGFVLVLLAQRGLRFNQMLDDTQARKSHVFQDHRTLDSHR